MPDVETYIEKAGRPEPESGFFRIFFEFSSNCIDSVDGGNQLTLKFALLLEERSGLLVNRLLSGCSIDFNLTLQTVSLCGKGSDFLRKLFLQSGLPPPPSLRQA